MGKTSDEKAALRDATHTCLWLHSVRPSLEGSPPLTYKRGRSSESLSQCRSTAGRGGTRHDHSCIGVRKFLPKKIRILSGILFFKDLNLEFSVLSLNSNAAWYTPCWISCSPADARSRSSMPTAPTQLVSIMTANVSWILSSRFVRPRAPTTVGRRPKAPHSPSWSSWFWPEPLTVLRLQVISCRLPSSTLGHDQQAAEFGRCEPGKNGLVRLKTSLVALG